MPKEEALLHHIALHVLIAKIPNWMLWLLAMGLGLTTAAMVITPDLVPVIDEMVMGWLSASVLIELRKRGQIEDEDIKVLPAQVGK